MSNWINFLVYCILIMFLFEIKNLWNHKCSYYWLYLVLHKTEIVILTGKGQGHGFWYVQGHKSGITGGGGLTAKIPSCGWQGTQTGGQGHGSGQAGQTGTGTQQQGHGWQ